MIVFGIDPGYATVGYGVVVYQGGKCRYVAHGAVTTAADVEMSVRLREIYRDIHTLLDTYRPDAVAVEQLFFNSNQKTAINVAQARGVLLLACSQAGLDPREYTPLQVKQAVVGYGRAEKKQVMEMTRSLLSLKEIPKPDDAADALALAICHAHSAGSLLQAGKRQGL